jgi:hypothetical protein
MPCPCPLKWQPNALPTTNCCQVARQMAVLFDPVKSQGENGLVLAIQPLRDYH